VPETWRRALKKADVGNKIRNEQGTEQIIDYFSVLEEEERAHSTQRNHMQQQNQQRMTYQGRGSQRQPYGRGGRQNYYNRTTIISRGGEYNNRGGYQSRGGESNLRRGGGTYSNYKYDNSNNQQNYQMHNHSGYSTQRTTGQRARMNSFRGRQSGGQRNAGTGSYYTQQRPAPHPHTAYMSNTYAWEGDSKHETEEIEEGQEQLLMNEWNDNLWLESEQDEQGTNEQDYAQEYFGSDDDPWYG
jgi:hypothetical protein